MTNWDLPWVHQRRLDLLWQAGSHFAVDAVVEGESHAESHLDPPGKTY